MVTFLFSLFFWVWNPLWIQLVLADNNQCIGSDLDWYTNAVGETPCRTYERLRQICDSNFRTGVMNTNTPPDYCTDQVPDCCCNNIAFSLSMLCLNCQQDNNSQNGIDAGAGAYQMFTSAAPNGCTATNRSLPDTIQTATCNKNIKIMDGVYNTFWDTGDWFYTFFRQTAEVEINEKNGKVFSHCPDTSTTTSSQPSNSPTPTGTTTRQTTHSTSTTATSGTTDSGRSNTTPTSSSTTTSDGGIGGNSSPDSNRGNTTPDGANATGGAVLSTSSTSLQPGVIAGIVVAVILLLVLLAILAFLCWRRRRNAGDSDFRAPFDNYSQAHTSQSFSSRPVSDYQYSGATGWPTGPMSVRSGASSNPFSSSGGMSAHSRSGSSGAASGYSNPANRNYNPHNTNHQPMQFPSGAAAAGFAAVGALGATPVVPNRRRGEKGSRPGAAGPDYNTSRSSDNEHSERHEDAGPVLTRSASGRLPPAYNRDWEDDSNRS